MKKAGRKSEKSFDGKMSTLLRLSQGKGIKIGSR